MVIQIQAVGKSYSKNSGKQAYKKKLRRALTKQHPVFPCSIYISLHNSFSQAL